MENSDEETQEINSYNPYQKIKRLKPAKLIAKNHKKASKFGKLPQKISSKGNFCKCCHRPQYTEKYTLYTNSNKFSLPTLSIYFKFVLFAIFVLIFNFVMIGIYSIFSNSTIGSCFLNNCEYKTKFEDQYNSTFNKILIFLNILIMILSKYLFFNYIRKFNYVRDEERTTPSDYTILIKGLNTPGKNYDLKKTLEVYFKSFDKEIEIEKINYIYNISEYVEIVKKYLLIQKKISILEFKQENPDKIDQLRLKSKELKDKLEIITKEFKQKMKKKFTGEAFITFAKQKHMRKVVEKSHTNIFFFKLQKGSYKITRAKEPNDIIWENFGLTGAQKFIKKLISFLITFIIIAISFTIIYAFKVIQRSNQIQFIYNILISITISIINIILRLILRILTNSEKRTFFTYKESSLVYKLVIGSFVNSGLIIVVVSIILNRNDLESSVWGGEGIAANVYVLMIFSFFLDVAYGLVSPFHLLLKLKRYFLERKLRQIGKVVVLQCEMNDVYEGINFNYAERFYQIFRIVALAFFFQTILPYGLIIAALHLIIVGIIYKNELVKFCNRPKDLDFNFSMKMISNFELCTFLLACGFLTFSELSEPDNLNPLALAAVILTGIDWLFFDVKFVFNYFKKKESLLKPKDRGYSSESIDFPTDYDRMNPTTQKRAYEDWLLSLKDRQENKLHKSLLITSTKSYLSPDEKVPEDFLKTIYDYLQVNNNVDTNDITLMDIMKKKNVVHNDLNFYALNNLTTYNAQQQIIQDVRLKKDPYIQKNQNKNNDIPLFMPIEDIPLGYGGTDDLNIGNLKSTFFFNPNSRGRNTGVNQNLYPDLNRNKHLDDMPLFKQDLRKKDFSPDQPLLKDDFIGKDRGSEFSNNTYENRDGNGRFQHRPSGFNQGNGYQRPSGFNGNGYHPFPQGNGNNAFPHGNGNDVPLNMGPNLNPNSNGNQNQDIPLNGRTGNILNNNYFKDNKNKDRKLN